MDMLTERYHWRSTNATVTKYIQKCITYKRLVVATDLEGSQELMRVPT